MGGRRGSQEEHRAQESRIIKAASYEFEDLHGLASRKKERIFNAGRRIITGSL